MRERDNVLLVFPDVPAAMGKEDIELEPVVLDPRKKADTFPKGWVISDRAALDWSDDGKRVFFGMKEQVPAPRHDARDAAPTSTPTSTCGTRSDERIQSVQMIRAEQDRNFTYPRSVRRVREASSSSSPTRRCAISTSRRTGAGPSAATRAATSRDYKRPAADIYRVNTTTGERTLMLKNQIIDTSTGSHTFGISPDGHYFLYWKDSKFQAYDLDAAATKTLGGPAPINFVDEEYDHPGPKPSYGIDGFTRGRQERRSSQQRYDSGRCRSTDPRRAISRRASGAKNEMQFRYVRTEPTIRPAPSRSAAGAADWRRRTRRRRRARTKRSISRSRCTLSAYGEWTKKAGFYELANGELKELVYEDASFAIPIESREGGQLPLHAPDVHRVPRPARLGPGLHGREEDQRRQSAAGRVPLGSSHAVRLQGQGRPSPAGHPRDSRRLQAGREAADARELLREELAEPASLHRAVVSDRAWDRRRCRPSSDGYITMLPDVLLPHRRVAQRHARVRSKPR